MGVGFRRVTDTKLLNTSRHRRTMNATTPASGRKSPRSENKSERWSLNTHKLMTGGLGSAWTHRSVRRQSTELHGAQVQRVHGSLPITLRRGSGEDWLAGAGTDSNRHEIWCQALSLHPLS